jgi:hypothetical protein
MTDIFADASKKIPYWILALVLALMPAVVIYFLIRFIIGLELQDFVPSVWVDQSNYWHEVATFIRAGFDGGFYGQNEMIARIQFFHFGWHGPFYPVLFGLIGRLFGWTYYSGILINMAFFAIGFVIFTIIVKPNMLQLCLAGLLCITFWPIPMFMQTISLESANQAIGLVMAGIFYILFKQRHKTSNFTKAASIFFLFIFSIGRLSWGLLFIPFFALITPPTLKRQAVSLILSILVIGLAVATSALISPPGLNSIIYVLSGFKGGLLQGISTLLGWIEYNFADYLKNKSILYLGFFMQVFGLVLYYLFFLTKIVIGYIKRNIKSVSGDICFSEAAFHIYNVGVVTIAIVLSYFLDNASRILGPHLLITLLLMLMFRRYSPFIIAIIINCILIPAFLVEFRVYWRESFLSDKQRILEVQKDMESYIQYRDDAQNAWCNTMLISHEYVYDQFLITPPGIGIQYIAVGKVKELELPLKSRYLVLDDEKVSRLRSMGQFNIELLGTLINGRNLYRNLDSSCDQ